MRLSPAGSRLLDAWLDGEVDAGGEPGRRLQQRLVLAGLIHPVVEAGSGELGSLRWAVVIPVFDDVEGLRATLAAVRAEAPDVPVVVVDDASTGDPAEVDELAERFGARMMRHETNRGPAAARNTAWRSIRSAPAASDTEVVVFVDSDVVPAPGCIPMLLAHLRTDDELVAVAPRVRARPGTSVLERYEQTSSPLDLGESAAIVRPGSAVPYVPSTIVAIRLDALEVIHGFGEQMRMGEDVDLVWRLVAGGGTVRYEPRAVAHHRSRPSWRALARQRHGYGTAAAELHARHPGDVAPIELPASTLVAWGLGALGGFPGALAGAAVAASDAARLARRLGGGGGSVASAGGTGDVEPRVVLGLSARGHAHAARWLAHAVRRVWLPALLPLALISRRMRVVLCAATVGAIGRDWLRWRPAVDPLCYLGARLFDDIAYGSGVWRGAFRRRSIGALLPRTRPRTRAGGSGPGSDVSP